MTIIGNSSQLINSINANAVFTMTDDNRIEAKTGFSKLLQRISDFFSFRSTLEARQNRLDQAMGNMLRESPLPNATEDNLQGTSPQLSEKSKLFLDKVQDRLAIANMPESLQGLAKNILAKTGRRDLLKFIEGWRNCSEISKKDMEQTVQALKTNFVNYQKTYINSKKNQDGFHEQFLGDYKRQNLEINGQKINSEQVLENLKKTIPDETSRLFLTSMMCQTIFGSPSTLFILGKDNPIKAPVPEGFPVFDGENFQFGNVDEKGNTAGLNVNLQISKENPNKATISLKTKVAVQASPDIIMNNRTMGFIDVNVTIDCDLGPNPSISNYNLDYSLRGAN
ncbi:MAG: hypothetical protein K5657_05970 [Desulfovibrio sp.]|nr:hypothetical protein [Desulfovibrio sp.]